MTVTAKWVAWTDAASLRNTQRRKEDFVAFKQSRSGAVSKRICGRLVMEPPKIRDPGTFREAKDIVAKLASSVWHGRSIAVRI